MCLLVACGGDDGPATPDANVVPDAIDGTCETWFFQFEGVSLTPGLEDAPNDQSSVVSEPETAPAFDSGDDDRDARLDAFMDQVTATLSPFGIAAVRDRPTTGDYHMVVVGGASTDIGLPADIGGISPFAGCGTPIPKRITFAFQIIGGNEIDDVALANLALGSLLVGYGTPTSDDPDNCLCWDSPSCTGGDGACELTGADTPRFDQSQCGTGTTYDQIAALEAEISCP